MPVSRLAGAVAAALCGAAISATVVPAKAEPPLPSGRFQVGATNIMCVKEPCPRIGVMLLREGVRARRPIYSGRTPPRIEGAQGARAEIERHWSLSGCLIVEGDFLQPAILRVDRVVGSCRR